MSFENLTTKKVYDLKPGDTITMGRNQYGLESPYISRKHRKLWHFDRYSLMYSNLVC